MSSKAKAGVGSKMCPNCGTPNNIHKPSIEDFFVPEGRAQVFLVRVGRRGAPEMQIRNTAGGRGVPLCYLDRKSVFRFTVMPGSYVVSSRSDRGDGLQEISLEAEAGTTYYITVGRQRCRCTGNPAPSMWLLSPEEDRLGRQAVMSRHWNLFNIFFIKQYTCFAHSARTGGQSDFSDIPYRPPAHEKDYWHDIGDLNTTYGVLSPNDQRGLPPDFNQIRTHIMALQQYHRRRAIAFSTCTGVLTLLFWPCLPCWIGFVVYCRCGAMCASCVQYPDHDWIEPARTAPGVSGRPAQTTDMV